MVTRAGGCHCLQVRALGQNVEERAYSLGCGMTVSLNYILKLYCLCGSAETQEPSPAPRSWLGDAGLGRENAGLFLSLYRKGTGVQ